MESNVNYSYLLISTKDSSFKYGKCEICKLFVSEVYHQIESFNNSVYNCTDLFGHKECLILNRRNGK